MTSSFFKYFSIADFLEVAWLCFIMLTLQILVGTWYCFYNIKILSYNIF